MDATKRTFIKEVKELDNEEYSYVLSKVEFQDGSLSYEVKHKQGDFDGVFDEDYFSTEKEARDHIKNNI